MAVAIALLVFVIWTRQRSKGRPGPSNVSLFSAAGTSTIMNSQARPYPGYAQPHATFDTPSYTPATIPYHNGARSPLSAGSYNKHPEPMPPGPGEF